MVTETNLPYIHDRAHGKDKLSEASETVITVFHFMRASMFKELISRHYWNESAWAEMVTVI